MKNICVKGILILLLCLTQFVVFAQTPSVGGTNMSVDVSPMGSASATIPIFCPPGRLGMLPQVAITYNSNAGEGLLGKNISLSGTSAITRSGNNYHLNGYQEGVQLDNNNDNFELDGMRLIWVGGAPRGTNGSIYRTEEEQFSKIIFSGNDFKVELKDGGVLFYGQGGNSLLVSSGATAMHATAYYLYRRYDIDGNYIEYNYQMPGGQIQLTEIKYTGFDCTLFNTRSCSTYPASPPFNKVLFTYKAAAANNKVWVKGTSLQTDKILDKIEVFEGANKVRGYELTYTHNTLHNYLTQVKEFNNANEFFEPIVLNWKEDGAVTLVGAKFNTTYPNADVTSTFAGDFNGDGKSDVLLIEGMLSLTQSGHLLSTNHTYKVYSINPGTKNIDNKLLNIGLLCNNGTDAMNNITQILVGDLNQDGLDDILCQTIGHSWTNSSHMILDVKYHAMIAKLDSSGKLQFNVERNYFAGYYNSNYTQHNIVGIPSLRFTSYLGDCDGDGLTDLIEIAKDQTITSNFLFHNAFITYGKNKGAKYHLAGYNAYLQNFSNAFITDFDGNGKTDITLVFETFTDVIKATASDASWGYLYHSLPFPTSIHKGLQPGDFNGDGKTDLMYYTDRWYISYSTGIGWDEFDASTLWAMDNISPEHGTTANYNGAPIQNPWKSGVFFQIGDFNGDGKSDILERHFHPFSLDGHIQQDYKAIYYSTGYGFNRIHIGANGNSTTDFDYNYSLIADFDGDGKSDVFSREFATGSITRSYFYSTIEYFNNFALRLEKISPSAVSEHVFAFKPLPQSTQFKKANGFVFDATVSLVPRLWVVETYTQNVLGTNPVVAKTFKYYYDNLLFHRHGRGMMGFKRTATIEQHTDVAKRTTILSENQQDLEYSYKLNPALVKTFRSSQVVGNFIEGDNLLGQKEIANFSVPVVSNFGASSTTAVTATHFSYISYITETDFVKQVKKRTCFRYDINGNLDFSRTDYYQVANYNNIEHISTSFSQYEQKGSWLPSLVNKTQTTLIRIGAPQTHTDQTDITNNIRNKPTRVQKFVNTPNLYLSNELLYDGYGNITHKKIDYTANTTGNPIVTDVYTYSNNGRFLSTTKNVLNQTTTYTFELVYGNKLTVTDANGLICSYTYDNWGRISQTNASNGNTTSVLRSWNTTALPTFVSTIMPRFYVHTYNNLGEKTTEYYDNAGRKIATQTNGLGTANTYTDIVYDAEQRVSKESNVYASASDKLYSETVYDLYNRPSQQKYNNILMARYAYDKTAVAVTTKIEGQDITKTTTTYATGHTSKVQDAGGEIVYSLGAHNLPISIVTSGNTTSIQYNAALQQTQLCDPNAGCSNYEYDALGQLTKQTDATNNIYTMQYDIAGRLIKKKGGANEEYEYRFYGTVGQASLNQLQIEELKIAGVSTHTINYTYGTKGELLTTTEAATNNFTNKVTSYTYDNFNRVNTITYPNVKTQNIYDATNNHIGIKLIEKNSTPVNIMLWNKTAELADGRTSQFELGNGFVNTYMYDANQQLSRIYTAKATAANAGDVAINTYYSFELQSGNLTQRQDKVIAGVLGLENFYYDNMDRLVSIQQPYKVNYDLVAPYLSLNSTYTIAYASNGNITGKYDAGIYTYDASKPHAVKTNEYQVGMIVPRITPLHFAEEQQLTYTAFNKVATITQLGALGTNKPVAIAFDYGVSEQRIKMEITENNMVTNTTYYINSASMELVNEDEVTYLYAEGKPIAMHRKSDNAIYYLHVDYQGSLMAITNEAGTIVENRSYDAWGRPRRIDNLEYNLASPFGGSNSSFTLRGYTFHEHLEMVGLINMNGRMYDPVLGRMLSADNYVQQPNNTQSYNRYSYCVNNPTKNTDKNGYWFGADDAVATGLGFAVGYLSYGLATGNFGWKAVAAGGVGAAVAWLGWNTMGAGAAALGQAGTATSLSSGASAVFGSAGGNFGVQYATLTGMNTMMHKEQLNKADEKGWSGVLAFAAYSTSAVLSTSLSPFSIGTKTSGLGLRQWAGVVLTNNISDNMENGELKFNSVHIGPIGYDSKRNDKNWGGMYTVFSNGLSKGERFNMAFETLLGLSQVKSDVSFWTRKPELHRPFCGELGVRLSKQPQIINVNTSQIGYWANRGMEVWNTGELILHNHSLYQHWYDEQYNADGTAKY